MQVTATMAAAALGAALLQAAAYGQVLKPDILNQARALLSFRDGKLVTVATARAVVRDGNGRTPDRFYAQQSNVLVLHGWQATPWMQR